MMANGRLMQGKLARHITDTHRFAVGCQEIKHAQSGWIGQCLEPIRKRDGVALFQASAGLSGTVPIF